MLFTYNLKRLLSFVYPIVIQRIDSDVSGILELTLHNGKLLLDTDTANYSFGSLHDVFRSAIKELDFDPKKKSALILGFGAGSIATILNKEMKLNLQIDGVDLDPVMLEIYKDYFIFENDNCTLYAMDIMDYLESCKVKYDHIFVDVFVNLDVPEAILTKKFIQLLTKCSTPETAIVINTMLEETHPFIKMWMDNFNGKTYFKNYDAANLVLFAIGN